MVTATVHVGSGGNTKRPIYDPSDELTVRARKAINATDLVVFLVNAWRQNGAMVGIMTAEDPQSEVGLALANVYNDLANAQANPAAFCIAFMEAYADPEDAALFKMFWSGR